MATGGLLPDLTLVLNVDRAAARGRIGPSRDRLEDRADDYHELVNRGFREALELMRAGPEGCTYYPSPMTPIDASKDADDVAQQIRKAVEHVLRLDPRP